MRQLPHANRKVSRDPVRPHRASSSWSTALGCLGLSLALCCGLSLLVVGAAALDRHVGGFPVYGLLLAAGGVAAIGYGLWEWFGWRAAARWAVRSGGTASVDRADWPRAMREATGQVRVGFAVRTTVGGFPVVVGRVKWEEDGACLSGAVTVSTGSGSFAVLKLPTGYAYTTVQRRATGGRRGQGEDAFWNEYRIIIDDMTFADQLISAELRRAHLRGQIPPWAIIDDELYIVRRTMLPLTPKRARRLTSQLLQVAALLDISPTDPAPSPDGR
ncbi:hypothetical protein [Catellatospora citrea]|uniref:DUF3137 domain-containing protein n=1 Tax=Catellatospora citrea TaxID=53366 RepID=A0A8J3KCE9_9ACTN|nr:hypothetical protein [Catellatospora citrea]RKE09481.1 hypothetical protein C8E86_4368 [Catellatospora citrea]GIF97441.1 hypothetical protein Cci01nite_25350 [Catellatospora citrea]